MSSKTATPAKDTAAETKAPRPTRAINWQSGDKLRDFRDQGGTVVFITNGKSTQGPIVVQGHGLEFESNLAAALGTDQPGLEKALKGKTIYASSAHPTMVSDPADRVKADD